MTGLGQIALRLGAFLIMLAARGVAAEPEPLLAYHETVLGNGLRIVVHEDFAAPVAAVQLWYHVGSKDEDPQRQGFAHMFEHMMFRGTDRLGPTDHFENIRRVGGSTNAYTSFDQTVYVATIPANQLELVLALEAERMGFLRIDQDAFDTERKVVEEERRLGLNQPYGTALETVLAGLYESAPYRWSPIGRIPHLRAASVGELREFWTRFYVPNNATLVVAGAVRADQVVSLAEKYFGWMPRYPDPVRNAVREPDQTEERRLRLREKNAPAPAIGVIFRTVPAGHPDALALEMLASILGGGDSSRLHRELVAERSLAAFAAAIPFTLEDDGIFGAGAVLAPMGARMADAERVIATQFDRIRTELVSDEELEKARNQRLRSVVTDALTAESQARLLGTAAVIEHRLEGVNDRLERIRAVTAEDLRRVATTYLAPHRATWVEVPRNLLGSLLGGSASDAEESAPITAEREVAAPAPGRAGLRRPDWWPESLPSADLIAMDPTISYSQGTLENGLRVMVVEDHSAPFVTATLGLDAGAWTEAKPGAASMAMSLLTKGTSNRSESELARELDQYAITLGGAADMDSSSLTATCLTAHLARAMDLLADAARNPTFPQDQFVRESTRRTTTLSVSANEPSSLAQRELASRLFGEHPYARQPTGELADVRRLTAQDARDWWASWLRPERAVLLFSGDVTLEDAMELSRLRFGDWTVPGVAPEVVVVSPPDAVGTYVVLVDQPGAVQAQVRVGQLSISRDDPRWATARVVSGYFGGAFDARLNRTIRVERGLTYGASGGFRSQRFHGSFVVSTFSKTESVQDTVGAILGELDRLWNEPPNESEIDDTKRSVAAGIALQRETAQQRAGVLWDQVVFGLSDGYHKEQLERISAIEPDDCVRFAQEAVDPSRLVIVVVGDASRLAEPLKRFGPVVVVPSGAGPSAPLPAD